jgi:hypothetical protein
MRSVVIVALSIVFMGCGIVATENPPAAPATDPNQLGGTVLETLDAASYTYVRFSTSAGEVWAAVPKAQLEIGSQVVIANPQEMANFESKTLGRTFETIYFGTIKAPTTPAMTGGSNSHGSMPGGMGKTTSTANADAAPIKVDKAEGATARTVAELYAEKDALSGKTVALQGKVVKYSAGIMGRNWIHLQDGSGDAAAGTNDITVTSNDTAAVGDIILIEGTVTLDKDFGAGYLYAVIVEDASVK